MRPKTTKPPATAAKAAAGKPASATAPADPPPVPSQPVFPGAANTASERTRDSLKKGDHVVWRYTDVYADPPADVERRGVVTELLHDDAGTPTTARVAWLDVSGPIALEELEKV